MALITPAGKPNFNWSPERDTKGLTKTASKGNQEEQSDKDILYKIAQGIVDGYGDESDTMDEINIEQDTESTSDEVTEPTDTVVEEVSEEVDAFSDETSDETGGTLEESVQDLSEAISDASSALAEVEVKVDEVADAANVSVEGEGSVDEIEIEIIDDEGTMDDSAIEEVEEVEISISDDGEVTDEATETPEESGGEDIIQRSAEDDNTGECDKTATAAKSSDSMVKLSKINPTTKKKIYDYFVNQAGWPKDYAKLMTTNYEK